MSEPLPVEAYVETSPTRPQKRRIISIRWTLPLFVVTPVVIGIALTSSLAYISGKRAIDDSIDTIGKEVAKNIENEVLRYLEAPISLSESALAGANSGVLNLQDMRALSNNFWRITQSKQLPKIFFYGNRLGHIAYSERTKEEHIIKIKDVATQDQYITYLADNDGNPVTIKATDAQYNPKAQDWYKNAKKHQQPIWSQVYVAQDGTNLVLTRATPFFNASGQLEGVFGSDISLLELNKFLDDLTESSKGEAFILEKTGALIAASNDANLFSGEGDTFTRVKAEESSNPLLKAMISQLSQKNSGHNGIADHTSSNMISDGFSFNYGGQAQLAYVYNLDVNSNLDSSFSDWLIVVTIPKNTYTKTFNKNTRQTLFWGGVTTVVASLLAFAAARYMLQPIEKLNQAADDIKQHQFNPATLADVMQRPDEFSVLADVFDDMATVVVSREQTLADQVKQLEQEKLQYGTRGSDRYALDAAIRHAKQARNQYLKH
ncbi:HAMP domain protein [Synechococcus sp. PCC 7335]|uniref:cache domain-containing protein n=1 Tax=Synechococcus sp. (strain ATCC 29403 / PCC 7335) TaxID=91464 RepID=UPI00017ED2C7|nr:cache domain-containing protein [Synechococcus sp. PCC 7335]EDX83127.1 HAMP domain protein [Synechococcus sp. PCC 7335]